MNKYTNKVIQLYSKHELDGHTRENFHKWLIHKEDTTEKEGALFQLWNQTESTPTADTTASLSSLKLKACFNTQKRNVLLTVWKYAAAIVFMLSATAVCLFTGHTSQKISFAEQFVSAGQVDTLLLPDGSAVIANSGTIIL